LVQQVRPSGKIYRMHSAGMYERVRLVTVGGGTGLKQCLRRKPRKSYRTGTWMTWPHPATPLKKLRNCPCLHKWVSNEPTALTTIPAERRSASSEGCFWKTLGIHWDRQNDYLIFMPPGAVRQDDRDLIS
ncbi:hypothetical protein T11_14617, partial [Trichinella zimbabwensis]